jgi:hypothetical protein
VDDSQELPADSSGTGHETFRPDSSDGSRLGQWIALRHPLSVWMVTAALVLEGLGLAACAVIGLLRVLPGSDHVASVSIALAVSSAAGAWLMLACGIGIGSGKSWPRGPAITVQVLGALVGVSFIQGGAAAIGFGLLGGGLVVGIGLLSGPVSRFTGRRTYSPDQDELGANP